MHSTLTEYDASGETDDHNLLATVHMTHYDTEYPSSYILSPKPPHPSDAHESVYHHSHEESGASTDTSQCYHHSNEESLSPTEAGRLPETPGRLSDTHDTHPPRVNPSAETRFRVFDTLNLSPIDPVQSEVIQGHEEDFEYFINFHSRTASADSCSEHSPV